MKLRWIQMFLCLLMLLLVSCQVKDGSLIIDSNVDEVSTNTPGTDTQNGVDEVLPESPESNSEIIAYRDASIWPFSADSPWNMPIGNEAEYEDANEACTNSLTYEAHLAAINSSEWSHPVYKASISDPVVGIYNNGSLQMRINVPANAKAALPMGGGTDAHLHIIDPSGRYVVEMWRAFPGQAGDWNVEFAIRLDLHGSGVMQGGARAYAGSAIGGLIRKGELKVGIPHALAIAQPYAHLWPGGAIWPALRTDENSSYNYTGEFPMGQLAAIPSQIDLESLRPPLSPQGLAIGKAMQNYGVYNVDAAGRSVLYAEPAAANELGDVYKDIPRLWALLSCIKNNFRDSLGGGGSTRRAPLAPAFKNE